jgi:Flp pilus assembly protein TadG
MRRATRSLMFGDDGAALIEFTIIAPLLVVMSIYTMDFGLLFFKNMEVQNAAQAGVNWAIANRVYNYSRIQTAVNKATNGSGVSVSPGYPLLRCGCPSSTGVAFTTYVPNSCPSCGALEGALYATVQTQATYNSLAGYGLFSGASATRTLTAESTARIQ